MWFRLAGADWSGDGNSLGSMNTISGSWTVQCTTSGGISKTTGAGFVTQGGTWTGTFTLATGATFTSATLTPSTAGKVTSTTSGSTVTVTIANVSANCTLAVVATGGSGGGTIDPIPSGGTNLWTITDTDALFEGGIYRTAAGVSANASQFDDTYPSSEKIYINGNEGTFKLNLVSGKTYRWQMIPNYSWGIIILDTPWGTTDKPFKGTDGKNFWFYDANDTLIANNSTTSPDGLYLMTIPEGAVYMRFLSQQYNSYPDKIKPLYANNLMVTEGETEYPEYIAPVI